MELDLSRVQKVMEDKERKKKGKVWETAKEVKENK